MEYSYWRGWMKSIQISTFVLWRHPSWRDSVMDTKWSAPAEKSFFRKSAKYNLVELLE
jgi:hypothetical protein